MEDSVVDFIPSVSFDNKERAAEFEIPRPCTVKQLLADRSIEIVVNLTVPKAHATVAMQALKAGKSVYNEKPLAVEREDAQEMLERCSGDAWEMPGRGSVRRCSGKAQ